MTKQRLALFSGLVYDENEQLLATASIGSEAQYILLDHGFKRHIPAETIDRQVVDWLQKQANDNKELVSENIMSLMGKDDLFTKVMVDSSIGKMDQVMDQGIPEDARNMLGMMGFKIIVDHHGDVIDLKLPGGGIEGSDEDDW
ncbi:hypothetical protein QUF64_03800 [Anaerolineales bacterium HSG6]|nr:hypothetical protein [Anaerolineales bacterium HSG6]MDM8531634.1 hypothetical protein [Anaerolineales bacterium HSG25]